VSDGCLTLNQQIFSYVSMKWWWWWWCPLCTRPTPAYLNFNSAETSPRIDMSLHSDTFSWFRTIAFTSQWRVFSGKADRACSHNLPHSVHEQTCRSTQKYHYPDYCEHSFHEKVNFYKNHCGRRVAIWHNYTRFNMSFQCYISIFEYIFELFVCLFDGV
jgi:hypothetical protein